MPNAEYKPIEETSVFAQFHAVANGCWNAVRSWPPFEKSTIGRQLVRAVDSVGANLVEGDGRFLDTDTLHFFVTARASAREARYWLPLAAERSLLEPIEASELIATIEKASKELNGLISYRRKHAITGKVREEGATYEHLANTPYLTSDPA